MDRAGPGRGCRGGVSARCGVRPAGQPCRPDPRQPAAPGSAPEVRPARGLENGLVRFDRQQVISAQVNISFERYLFAICGRHEIRCQWGVVGPFPRRNGILAAFPFGIDVRHDDRAMEGLPIFP
jgi:hypothetical protein